MIVVRPDGLIEANIKGWNATHVLFDYRHIDEKGNRDKTWVRNMSRPILGFMLDYGLL